MKPDVQEYVDRYRVAVAFARAFIDELGEKQAYPIIQRAFEDMQIEAAHDLAEELGDNSLEALAAHYRKLASERDNLEIVEVTGEQIALKITRCRAFEAFSHLGMPELCQLYCNSDDAYIKAFNPQMRMIRTRTIASGDAYCDHIWALE
jgi:hypothetical protein